MNRAYGGVLSGSAVRERYAFFVQQNCIFAFDICKLRVSRHKYINLCMIYLCRIIRAFLVEEQKIVKKVLKIQKAKEKLASKN